MSLLIYLTKSLFYIYFHSDFLKPLILPPTPRPPYIYIVCLALPGWERLQNFRLYYLYLMFIIFLCYALGIYRDIYFINYTGLYMMVFILSGALEPIFLGSDFSFAPTSYITLSKLRKLLLSQFYLKNGNSNSPISLVYWEDQVNM